MNQRTDSLNRITDTIRKLGSHGQLKHGVESLLNVLGYASSRTLNIESVADFLQNGRTEIKLTESRRNLFRLCKRIEMVFQITASEIVDRNNRDSGYYFDEGRAESFLFFAIDMFGTSYSRTQLSDIARSVNSLFAMPVIVFFRHGATLTLAVVHRRPDRRIADRDVLEKVTLAKDIHIENPHRAHREFLSSLDLERMIQLGARNFDDLHKAWEEALDVETLNKRFYRELFSWFECAVRSCRFPDDHAGDGSTERHIIRMITRLLFIWFLKEKGLIPVSLFEEEFVSSVLKRHNSESGDYYRVVLQNLFFATLNTEIGDRGFTENNGSVSADPSKYKYISLLTDPQDLIVQFNEIPFVNGGLFDCLDQYSASGTSCKFIDVFSELQNSDSLLHVPAHLFFDENGLYPLLRRYKFTVEENTPLDHEVALDPELLGSVFENLLAAYNPETREKARNATGSYYTPRKVVDFMVTDSLIESIAPKTKPYDIDESSWRERLRSLLDYSDGLADTDQLFNDSQKQTLVSTISELRTIDLAVGSGAFPMGILQSLTLALRRLDPTNTIWESVQKKRAKVQFDEALDVDDQETRNHVLTDISNTFEKYRESDFGRKLYLIQNAIYGVDIQSIACQIAKLRFFISLTIEQTVERDSKTNFGIRPLPNLETKFIAADSLTKLSKDHTFGLTGVQNIVDELTSNREQHFNAATPALKQSCRDKDEYLRNRVKAALAREGFGDEDIEKIAEWNPYDQNSVSSWFDPAYMFGVEHFDIVIGNPPYIQLQRNDGELRKKYEKSGYGVFASTGDIYQLFFERGMEVVRDGNGILAYISSNSWLKAKYGKKLRRFFSELHSPLKLIELGTDVFENAIVDSAVLIVRSGRRSATKCIAVDMDLVDGKEFPPNEHAWGVFIPRGQRAWMSLTTRERDVMEKIESRGTLLKFWDISIYRGITTGLNDAFLIDQTTRDELVRADPNAGTLLKPVLRGRDIWRYRSRWRNQWLIDTHNGYGDVEPIDIDEFPSVKNHLKSYENQLRKRYDKGVTPFNLRNCAYHADFLKEKLFWMDLTPVGRFSYESEGSEMFCLNSAFFMHGRSIKVLAAFLNSELVTWYVNKVGVTSGLGVPRWIKETIDEIPVPSELRNECEYIELVDERLTVTTNSTTANEIEHTINEKVRDAYGITEREYSIISKTFMP